MDGERLREGRPRVGADGRVVTPVADRAALAALKEQAAAPVALPAPEAILRRAQDLDRVFKADPTRLRQKLLRFFERGQVLLDPQPDGTYVAMESARIDVHSQGSGDEAPPKASESARHPVDADAFGPEFGPTRDGVEWALARALDAAASAGRFDVVAQLARELAARRLAREPNVVALPPQPHDVGNLPPRSMSGP
jgi:hypothetical protein